MSEYQLVLSDPLLTFGYAAWPLVKDKTVVGFRTGKFGVPDRRKAFISVSS